MPAHVREITISLPIADRRRAMHFYRTAFDFEPVGAPEEDGIPEPLTFRLDDRTLLALIPAAGLAGAIGRRPLAPSGVSECLLGVTLTSDAEVDRLVERIADSGGSILSAAAREDWGYTALCADPDGHAWQIFAEPAPTS
ncbi:VOC family protein [Agromyces aerolatus]|uniref:VOC family protein n=1 Tax=Agromyces sp. LY-1074 TaxID=3074080 RepID=UPI002860039A|nr:MULTISPECIES: VOC family protein [unclassified Agromyces]MDR5701187.1 VOC family protein [Agromyces sp. LY-1074]MDR5706937.1 VOC family protein [Agromyces sp. LY-1358]